ncbi:MAG: zf-TFIIB domain-containing protein [Acidobacteriota bacterium]
MLEAPPSLLDVRHPCPVCLGVKMEAVTLGGNEELTLDRCGRCGGIYFDADEVEALSRLEVTATLARIELPQERTTFPCHGCPDRLDRDADACPSCGWENRLSCPICERQMLRRHHGGRTLDVCDHCHGVWFDANELAAVWNGALITLLAAGASPDAVDRDLLGQGIEAVGDFLEALGPEGAEIVAKGAFAVGRVLLAEAPGIAASVLESSGDLAGAVFEALAEIIGAVAG